MAHKTFLFFLLSGTDQLSAAADNALSFSYLTLVTLRQAVDGVNFFPGLLKRISHDTPSTQTVLTGESLLPGPLSTLSGGEAAGKDSDYRWHL